MNHSVVEHDRHASAGGIVPKTLLLAAFAVATFLAGRLWSLREVREAQRAAGLAENERLALQAELTECRNALLLQRARGEVSLASMSLAQGRRSRGASVSSVHCGNPSIKRALGDVADRAMFFAPATKAPITLLELGLFARSGKLLVGCPVGFWRRGNVEVVCARYGIPLVDSLTALIDLVRLRLKS
jgi:hypothetical protein